MILRISVAVHLPHISREVLLDCSLSDPLSLILTRALAAADAEGNPESWMLRCRGVLVDPDQSLGDVLRSLEATVAELNVEVLPRRGARGTWTIATEAAPGTTDTGTIPPTPLGTAPEITLTMSAPAAPVLPPPPEPVEIGSPRGYDLLSNTGIWRSTAAVPTTAAPEVTRRATVRYYCRMNPGSMVPLLVILSDKTIQEVVKKHVVQAESQAFQVKEDSVVEIEPVLPGCDVYPPRDLVTIRPGESESKFWVVPHVLGSIHHARVMIRQGGKTLAEVPLNIKVVKQTVTMVAGASSLVMPYVSKYLEDAKQTWMVSQGEGFDLYSWLATHVLGALTPTVLGLALLAVTVVLYFLMRPRKRDVFWDVAPAD